MEIRRIQITLRLQQDLRVNLPGAALALELLEKLAALQGRSLNEP
jgi:chaperone modulatory protein CbpM